MRTPCHTTECQNKKIMNRLNLIRNRHTFESLSFVTRLSARTNFKDVKVHGQTSFAYPSIYTNARQNTDEIMNVHFSYPTYIVGAEEFSPIGKCFPTFSFIDPMRTSINGRGTVYNYFQPGRRYRR